VNTTKPSPALLAQIAGFQKNEMTEHLIYGRLARATRHVGNAQVLERISGEEMGHYQLWRSITGLAVRPNPIKVFFYYWVARVFGLTFGIKLMERGEGAAQVTYARVAAQIPEARSIAEDEERHEHELLRLLDEELLRYVGSIVLGLNDALVELTGALAGLTFALRNTRLVALAGMVTGIAASFSMAASEYLSTKSEGDGRNALKSAVYTGVAYVVTVLILILPYLVLGNLYLCLGVTLGLAVLIILVFNYYVSVAKDLPFGRRFVEMAAISLGVAVLSFGVGTLIRLVLGVEV
jgi:VIT1/CCC1 family predicted Fe2+/Mn2+ transporter